MPYYNTTNLSGPDLKKAIDKAKTQDEKVLLIFKNTEKRHLSPSQVWVKFKNSPPITSIRRSINTLTKKGYLEKLDILVEGFYGRPEHVWRIKNQ
jgi:hypothetical protein